MSTEVALRCGVTRASQPQPAPDGVEMQPEMQSRQPEMQSREKRASLAAGAAAAAEGWLRPGGWAEGWGFGLVGAAGRTDLLSRDEGEGEGAASDEGADEGRPQARNNSGRLALGLLTGGEHAMDHARRPRGATRRPCSRRRAGWARPSPSRLSSPSAPPPADRPRAPRRSPPCRASERANGRRVDTRPRTRRRRSLVSPVRAHREGPPRRDAAGEPCGPLGAGAARERPDAGGLAPGATRARAPS